MKAYPLKKLSVMGMKRRLDKRAIPNCFAACGCENEILNLHCDCGHDGNDDSGCVKCSWHYLKRIK